MLYALICTATSQLYKSLLVYANAPAQLCSLSKTNTFENLTASGAPISRIIPFHKLLKRLFSNPSCLSCGKCFLIKTFDLTFNYHRRFKKPLCWILRFSRSTSSSKGSLTSSFALASITFFCDFDLRLKKKSSWSKKENKILSYVNLTQHS